MSNYRKEQIVAILKDYWTSSQARCPKCDNPFTFELPKKFRGSGYVVWGGCSRCRDMVKFTDTDDPDTFRQWAPADVEQMMDNLVSARLVKCPSCASIDVDVTSQKEGTEFYCYRCGNNEVVKRPRQ